MFDGSPSPLPPLRPGQLTHRGFCSIFSLKQDEYTDRLVKIFDLDNGGTVGFREFVYGLSKFQIDTFERRLQFAYRLMDLDGDGALDKFELNAAMKAALDTDKSQYATGPAKAPGIKMPFRARPTPDNPITPGNPNDLRGEVERIARNMVRILFYSWRSPRDALLLHIIGNTHHQYILL